MHTSHCDEQNEIPAAELQTPGIQQIMTSRDSQGLRSYTSSHKGKYFHSKRGCEVTSCVLFGPDFNEHASSSSLAAVCAVI